MSAPILALHDVTVAYGGAPVLDVSSLTVEEGRTLAVIGPNGSGKSTLLRVLGLLEPPATGQVVFRGRPVSRRRELLDVRRRMATVFQEPLLTDGTVEENVSLGLRLRRADPIDRRRRLGEWMRLLGIAELANRRVRTLSGGEAQRVSIARALVLEPDVLLLDEPLAALDAPTRDGLLADLKRILAKARLTTLFVTHDRDEALVLGDEVAVMMGGRILQRGAPERVFSSPVSEQVARFVGVETILPGHVRAVTDGLAVVEVSGWTLEVAEPLRPGQQVLLCLRPEQITLFPREASSVASSARNQLHGRVVSHVPAGPVYRVTIDCGIAVVAAVTRQSWQELGLADGSQVLAAFKATAPHVIRRD